jgi:DNA-binding transcriptional regulator PaaX
MVQNKMLIRKQPLAGNVYFIGKRGKRISETVRRRLNADDRLKWDNSWILVSVQYSQKEAALREKLRRRLVWNGFAQRMAGVYIRPNWPHYDWKKIARDLGRGSDFEVLVGQLDRTESEMKKLVRKLWPIEELSKRALNITGKMNKILHTRVQYSPQEWFTLRFTLSGAAYDIIGHDPLLPLIISPERKNIVALRNGLSRFDRMARQKSLTFVKQILDTVKNQR